MCLYNLLYLPSVHNLMSEVFILKLVYFHQIYFSLWLRLLVSKAGFSEMKIFYWSVWLLSVIHVILGSVFLYVIFGWKSILTGSYVYLDCKYQFHKFYNIRETSCIFIGSYSRKQWFKRNSFAEVHLEVIHIYLLTWLHLSPSTTFPKFCPRKGKVSKIFLLLSYSLAENILMWQTVFTTSRYFTSSSTNRSLDTVAGIGKVVSAIRFLLTIWWVSFTKPACER